LDETAWRQLADNEPLQYGHRASEGTPDPQWRGCQGGGATFISCRARRVERHPE
jgi:hypothetical protein